MKYYIISFEFGGKRFHFGSEVKGMGIENVVEFLHSDTIFCILCNAWASMYGNQRTKEILDPIISTSSPTLRLSSMFLSANEKHFVPKPMLPFPKWDSDAKNELRKYSSQIKSTRFVSIGSLLKWLSGDHSDLCEKIIEDKKEYADLFFSNVQFSNTQDRFTANTQIFARGETTYKLKTRGYFIIQADENYKNLVEEAIRFVIELDGAFGGERSLGFGIFNRECRIDPIREGSRWHRLFYPQSTTNYVYLLSLFCPNKYDMELLKNSPNLYRYSLITRRGWFKSPFSGYQLKRKTVPMFGEGSIVPTGISGEIKDVSPQRWIELEPSIIDWHQIYRSGLALYAPVSI